MKNKAVVDKFIIMHFLYCSSFFNIIESYFISIPYSFKISSLLSKLSLFSISTISLLSTLGYFSKISPTILFNAIFTF